MFKTKVILPMAGYGTRVNAPTETGKELMIDPKTKEPLAKWALDAIETAGMEPHVVSRKNKRVLNAWIQAKLHNVQLLEEKDMKEWPDTVLRSEKYWHDTNIMMLPDTRFPRPTVTLKQLELLLTVSPIALAVIDQPDLVAANYAVVSARTGLFAEKPAYDIGTEKIALVAFRKEVGKKLFEGFSNRGEYFTVQNIRHIPTIKLEWFKDITRNGRIEEW